MPELFLHGRQINTVFDLLGDKENDITFSLGWALANCGVFSRQLLQQVAGDVEIGDIEAINLQESGQDGGYTDIEILTSHLHVIFEAKRGWNLPTDTQLLRYIPRLQKRTSGSKIITLSECSQAYAAHRLPQQIDGIPIYHLSWEQVAAIAKQSQRAGSHAEKRLLQELVAYLQGLITMQDQESNWVYVVSLGADTPDWSKLSWREIVNKQRQYFHPIGTGGWPRVPPNYLAFRYESKLQSIHHIEKYDVATDAKSFASLVPGVDAVAWRKSDDYFDGAIFVYSLGPAIIPPHEVVTGARWRANRVWVALDLLLTCNSIAEARALTEKRTAVVESDDS